MANEATVTAALQITKTSPVLQYQSRPTTFQATVTGSKGPSPGAVSIPTTGKDIYFTELTTPGLCRLANLDTANFVEYGIFDPQTNVFYPLGELLPGETYVLRFSRNLQEQYAGSGTGTGTPENYFRLKANGAAVNVLIEAFES